ncbi:MULTISPECIES: hypothetical protein [Legionella]|uniref:Endo-1,3-beta-glucanase btgC n=1 Tax=Legionella septentrionalis TaxID=2498109 RepID=A0A3S0XGN6_9GAMM|nr:MULTISPECIES: hypothetical protein [Legionella]MCP0912795.1 hypothetical protein [Legionella sp. 27cVA30]RUQ88677.1 hypothetical protein EKM59_05035 [Legionella septentrionalis]RUQ97079.1 hypothetical protein ELY11_06975 [Legionella septentrionalis]RUR11256.1 hypothetical protein ELY14_02650 [Legionella septentrionalis]RUR16311.1 hypothetical protein ELY10_03725 [Legionella septentrionalis]
MKKFLAMMLTSVVSHAALALERGINYDPAHSPAFTTAQQRNDINGMKNVIQQDLNAIRNAGFETVKTFYSSFSTVDGKQSVALADLACPLGLKVALGVFEFDPNKDNCSTWCEKATGEQVDKAILSANQYPNCVVMIVAGNEDIYNWNFTVANTGIQKRIATDISKLQKSITNKDIIITSAQQDGAWLALAKNDPYGILAKITHVGVNIYPFWSPEKKDVQAAKGEFTQRLKAIRNHAILKDKTAIVTEEGWPSSHSADQNPNASMRAEKNYYQWWQSRASTDDFDSYYFAMFDKQPINTDADNYFGLCSYTNKDKIIDACQ